MTGCYPFEGGVCESPDFIEIDILFRSRKERYLLDKEQMSFAEAEKMARLNGFKIIAASEYKEKDFDSGISRGRLIADRLVSPHFWVWAEPKDDNAVNVVNVFTSLSTLSPRDSRYGKTVPNIYSLFKMEE